MKPKNLLPRLALLCLPWLLTACAGTPKAAPVTAPPASTTSPAGTALPHELLNATLWIQTAEEYRGVTRTVYRGACQALDAALADPTWTAATEQQGDFGRLPPAVILDLDETVLDNSPFEATLIEKNTDYDSGLWKEWVAKAEAHLVPGALEFASCAADKGVELIYVTNRDKDEEQATIQNLEALEMPLARGGESVLTKGEQSDWVSDKTSRRRHLAASYRILLLIGDDLGDFVSVDKLTLQQRAHSSCDLKQKWGERWFLLPNPLYGSWERVLYDDDRDLSREQKLERKADHLRPFKKP